MQRFINGNGTQCAWLKSQLSPEGLKVFNDVSLPAMCSSNRCRVGFEYTQANGYKMYIDKNISFSGSHSGLRSLLTNGEASFSSFDGMMSFVRGLGGLFNASAGNGIFTATTPPPQNNTLNYTATSPHGHRYNFSFKYEKVGSIWRAYIVSNPSYGSRATDAHSTHRHNDGRYYVCYEPEPKALDEMVNASKVWADLTARYIDTGRSFG